MRKLLSIIAVCLLAGAARAATYSLPVTFSGYTKTETLTNFPALVKFTNSISGFAYSQFASTNGYDLRFTNSAGTTELNYEIESWNTNGESCVWVQVPLLTNGAFVTAYWGDATKTQQPYTTNGATWANGYVGVWHGVDLTTSAIKESTSNNFTSTKLGANTPLEKDGVIGKAQSFNGSSAAINVSESPILSVANSTIEMWIKANATQTDWAGIIGIHYGIDNDYMFQFDSSTVNIMLFQQGGNSFDTGYALSTIAGNWNYLLVTHNGTSVISYRNGQFVSSGSLSVPGTTAGTFTIGQERAGIKFAGLLDEIRVSNLARSSNWVWACYQNVASNSAFGVAGAVSGGTTGMSVWEQFARQMD